jgi:hypothetical protein
MKKIIQRVQLPQQKHFYSPPIVIPSVNHPKKAILAQLFTPLCCQRSIRETVQELSNLRLLNSCTIFLCPVRKMEDSDLNRINQPCMDAWSIGCCGCFCVLCWCLGGLLGAGELTAHFLVGCSPKHHKKPTVGFSFFIMDHGNQYDDATFSTNQR